MANDKIREAAQALGESLIEAFTDDFWDGIQKDAMSRLVTAGLPPGRLNELHFALLEAGIMAGGEATLRAAKEKGWLKP